MPATGTLYDETVKNGYGKFIAEYKVTTPIAWFTIPVPPAATYDVMLIEFLHLMPSVAATELFMRFSLDNGTTWDAGNNYWWSQQYCYSHGAAANARGGNLYVAAMPAQYAQYLYLVSQDTLAPLQTTCGEIYIHAHSSPHVFAKIQTCEWSSPSGMLYRRTGTQLNPAMNAVALSYLGANVASGTVRIYGIKKGLG